MVADGAMDEFPEKRMRTQRARFEFRVELRGHKKGMVFKLYDFDQVLFGIDPGRDQSAFFQFLPIVIIKFVAVAVAFRY